MPPHEILLGTSMTFMRITTSSQQNERTAMLSIPQALISLGGLEYYI
jgi:hypothetical protein